MRAIDVLEVGASAPTATIAIGPHSLAHGVLVAATATHATIRDGARTISGKIVRTP